MQLLNFHGSGEFSLVPRPLWFLCLWHSVFVLLSLKAVPDRGGLHGPSLLLGIATFGMERVRASGCMEMCPLLTVILASWEGKITKHNILVSYSVFLLLLMYTCRNVTSILGEWEDGGRSRSWLLAQPGPYCNRMLCRGLNFRGCGPSCACWPCRAWNDTAGLRGEISKGRMHSGRGQSVLESLLRETN